MKKHELLKHAYDNYPKGTKIYSTSGNGQIGMLNGNYIINSYGSVEDSSSFLIYNSTKDFGVWAEIISEDKSIVESCSREKFNVVDINTVHTTICFGGKPKPKEIVLFNDQDWNFIITKDGIKQVNVKGNYNPEFHDGILTTGEELEKIYKAYKSLK